MTTSLVVRVRATKRAAQAARRADQARIRDLEARLAATERRAAAAEMDPLTGLPNRAGLATMWRRRVEAGVLPGAVLLLDLDGFKPVNDTYGHAAGDQVLRMIGATLAISGHQAARLGGDEFVILVDGDRDAVFDVARRVGAQVADPIRVGRQLARVYASTGIRIVRPGETDLGPLLGDADTAMYQAKGRGRGQVVLHTPGMRRPVLSGGVRLRDARRPGTEAAA